MMKISDSKTLGIFCLTASLMMLNASQSQAAVGNKFIEGDLEYTVLTEDASAGTVSVGLNKYSTPNVSIPSSVENNGITYSVTTIGEYGFQNTQIRTIVIPDSVTTIEQAAFAGSELEYITIPDSVITIKSSAFYSCEIMASVVIGNSVTTFGNSVFEECEDLLSITIPDSVTNLGNETFYKCHSLESVVIGNGVSRIGYGTFSGCRSLSEITLPNSVTEIDSSAFSNCRSLVNITLSNGLTSIGSYAFTECRSLTAITIPETVTRIEDGAFMGCEQLEEVYYKGNSPEVDTNPWSSIYFATPETLISYYPCGNASWNDAIVDGQWQSRSTSPWEPPAPATAELSYEYQNGILILTYTGTLYQSSDAVSWTKVESASSPYQVTTAGNKKLFFCSKIESEKPSKQNFSIPLADNVILDMIWIQPGTFVMGSPKDELGRFNNETQHEVTLTKGYWLGKYEVTQAQYKAVMGKNPSKFIGDDLPVEQVNWNDAKGFCEKLTAIEKEAGRLPEGYEYTLPTEAQWEYACRAGTTTSLNNGKDLTDNYKCPELDEVGWYYNNSNKTQSVGYKQPNAWGLYDMHGNVYEWCLDGYGNYPTSPVTDPSGSGSESKRVLRGGGWDCRADRCRSAFRFDDSPSNSYHDSGFRVALAPVQ